MPRVVTFYIDNINKFEALIQSIRKKRYTVALSRLLVFVLLAASLYQAYKSGQNLYLFIAFACAIIFTWLVRVAADLSTEQAFYEELVFINRNEKAMQDGNDNGFNNGSEFLHFDSFVYDLDIFGDASVFHLLNRTTTSHGRSALASRLSHPEMDREQILARQDAVRVLANQQQVCQETIAYGRINREEKGTLDDVKTWIRMPGREWDKALMKLIRLAVPVATIATFLYYLSEDNYLPFIASAALTWIIIGRSSKYINEQHNLLGKKQAILEQYAKILRSFNTVDPEKSALLMRVKKTAEHAHHEIYKLSRLAAMFDQRYNMVVNIFLNTFLMFDLHLIAKLDRWKKKNRTEFSEWVECVGEIEALISVSVYAFNNTNYIYPEVLTSAKPTLYSMGLGHPLLRQEELVTNNFAPSKALQVALITGSNMSGKTTFLRSLGVNLVLAGCGAPVCAESFSFTPMKILTSIRINDSLREHTSYFMAELKRLSFIIRELGMHERSLVLIDEILRGTNSDDKTHGSAGYIRKLLQHKCLAFFATHDLSLSELEQGHDGSIQNYCFESTIVDGELLFDYKLREGVARNKNASFLMQKMGII